MSRRIICPKCKSKNGFDVIDISDVKAGEVILICMACGEEIKQEVTPQIIEIEKKPVS